MFNNNVYTNDTLMRTLRRVELTTNVTPYIRKYIYPVATLQTLCISYRALSYTII